MKFIESTGLGVDAGVHGASKSILPDHSSQLDDGLSERRDPQTTVLSEPMVPGPMDGGE